MGELGGVSSDKTGCLEGLRQEAFCYWVGLTNTENKLAVGLLRRRSQVVRQESAKLLCVGSNPTVASERSYKCYQ